MNTYYVYIVGNERPTLYIGITNNLQRRIYDHRQKQIVGFTQKYNLTKLLYYEVTNDVKEAIFREKQIKHWNREWKLNLIKSQNPLFIDLYDTII